MTSKHGLGRRMFLGRTGRAMLGVAGRSSVLAYWLKTAIGRAQGEASPKRLVLVMRPNGTIAHGFLRATAREHAGHRRASADREHARVVPQRGLRGMEPLVRRLSLRLLRWGWGRAHAARTRARFGGPRPHRERRVVDDRAGLRGDCSIVRNRSERTHRRSSHGWLRPPRPSSRDE